MSLLLCCCCVQVTDHKPGGEGEGCLTPHSDFQTISSILLSKHISCEVRVVGLHPANPSCCVPSSQLVDYSAFPSVSAFFLTPTVQTSGQHSTQFLDPLPHCHLSCPHLHLSYLLQQTQNLYSPHILTSGIPLSDPQLLTLQFTSFGTPAPAAL